MIYIVTNTNFYSTDKDAADERVQEIKYAVQKLYRDFTNNEISFNLYQKEIGEISNTYQIISINLTK